MKISVEWVRDYVALPDVPAAELATELTLKTVEVEDHVDTAAPFARVVAGRVAGFEPLGEGGRGVATCEVGTGDQVRVVTRLRELAEGDMVPVALPGARLALPDGGSAEVRATKVAGVQSEGVVCSVAELGLRRMFPGAPVDRALDLGGLDVPVGGGLAGALGFDDVVMEIDNKSLTNRPDLWGHYGIAREFAAIYGVELRPLEAAKLPPHAEGLAGEVDPDLCRRLAVVEFSVDEAVGEAPLWMRGRLARIGESSVNLCVDLSNYVMFTVGQPTHVYDADRVTLPLSVATSGKAADYGLLTGETARLDPATPVIEDAGEVVGIAGVMGGEASAVSPGSRRFALEAATFRPQPVRRASQRLGLRTEASARFEKGLDTQRVDAAVELFLNLLGQTAPGASVGAMQDLHPDPTEAARIRVDLGFLETRIGQSLEVADVSATLRALGFEVAASEAGALEVTAPTWRSTGDIGLPHDIVEEVARIRGYDSLPTAPLTVALKPVRGLRLRPLDRVMREQLATRAGLQEVVTYPWTADHLLAAAGFDRATMRRFEGAPAPDRGSLRPSLVPNLLEAVVTNQRYRQAFGLFEAGSVFPAGAAAPYREIFEPLPPEVRMIGAVLVGDDGPDLFRRAKGALEMLARTCHLTDLRFTDADHAPAWADRSARLAVTAGGAAAGTLGLLTKRCKRLAGIADLQVACFELDLRTLQTYASRQNRYEPISELPEADFDLSVILADAVRWREISSTVLATDELIHRVDFVDEFRGARLPAGHRSVTLRVTMRPRESTLTAEAIAAVRDQVITALTGAFDAKLRG